MIEPNQDPFGNHRNNWNGYIAPRDPILGVEPLNRFRDELVERHFGDLEVYEDDSQYRSFQAKFTESTSRTGVKVFKFPRITAASTYLTQTTTTQTTYTTPTPETLSNGVPQVEDESTNLEYQDRAHIYIFPDIKLLQLYQRYLDLLAGIKPAAGFRSIDHFALKDIALGINRDIYERWQAGEDLVAHYFPRQQIISHTSRRRTG